MKRFVALRCRLVTWSVLARCGSKPTYTIEDLLKVRRVGDPQVSPDGKRVAFTIGDVNFDGESIVNQIYVDVDRRRRHEAVDHRR